MGSKCLAIQRSSLSTVQKHHIQAFLKQQEGANFWCRDLLWVLVCWIQSQPLAREAVGKLFGQNVPCLLPGSFWFGFDMFLTSWNSRIQPRLLDARPTLALQSSVMCKDRATPSKSPGTLPYCHKAIMIQRHPATELQRKRLQTGNTAAVYDKHQPGFSRQNHKDLRIGSCS